MTTRSIRCPRCSSVMKVVESPDLNYEECPNCLGKFLDKGELNSFATGRAGDIEFCTIDDEEQQDQFSARSCPKCEDQEMLKMGLLGSSEVILDVCEECEGFFFDPDEIREMNDELRELTDLPFSEEHRMMYGDFLVRLDKIEEMVPVSYAGFQVPVQFGKHQMGVETGFYLEVSVYFPDSLDAGLQVTEGGLGEAILEVIDPGLRDEIHVGDSEFDSRFRIKGNDPDQVQELLGQEAQHRILSFLRENPSMLGEEGTLEITDDRVLFREGLYKEGNYNMEEDPENIRSRLLDIAKSVWG